jgi:hypothetical protein
LILDTEIKKLIEKAIDFYAMKLAINSFFVAFALPSSGQVLAIYYKHMGYAKKNLMARHMRQKTANLWLHPPSCCLEI